MPFADVWRRFQRHYCSAIHRHIFFASPCGVESQTASTAISGANAAQFGALVVAQSATHPPPANFDSLREPTSDQYFKVRLHMSPLTVCHGKV